MTHIPTRSFESKVQIYICSHEPLNVPLSRYFISLDCSTCLLPFPRIHENNFLFWNVVVTALNSYIHQFHISLRANDIIKFCYRTSYVCFIIFITNNRESEQVKVFLSMQIWSWKYENEAQITTICPFLSSQRAHEHWSLIIN